MAAEAGEVAALTWLGDSMRMCVHEIPAQARACECGLRAAVVTGPWQLALFAWPRDNSHWISVQGQLPDAIDGLPAST